MKKGQRIAAIAAACAAFVLVVGLAMRSGGEDGLGYDLDDTTVAARVNDVTITNGSVAREVRESREARGLLDDENWQIWLAGEHKSEDDVREERLESLIYAEVVRQAAAQVGVEVSDEEVAASIEEARANYADSLDDGIDAGAAWDNALRLNGLNERMYEERTRTRMLERAIADKVGRGEPYLEWMDAFEASCDIDRIQEG